MKQSKESAFEGRCYSTDLEHFLHLVVGYLSKMRKKEFPQFFSYNIMEFGIIKCDT